MARKVCLQCVDQDEIPAKDSQVMCFTAFKEELAHEDWQRLLRAPVRVMLQKLYSDQGDVSFLTPLWGKSFFAGGKRSEPEHATTVQFHSRIDKDLLRATLKLSGTCRVYVTPKDGDHRISGDFRIVWLQQSPAEITISLSKCSNHLGLVRSSRGSLHNRGIRFEKADFATFFLAF